jgi:AAA domain, putative AbiEii toxin, Type IV TA system
VIDIVRHFATFYPRPRPAEEVLDLVGLAEKARSRISQLSGCQIRRLDVALGIVGQPELLFLDEPTTGFDPGARRRFWDLIRRLREDGTTILLTTHYLADHSLSGRSRGAGRPDRGDRRGPHRRVRRSRHAQRPRARRVPVRRRSRRPGSAITTSY